MNYLEPSLCKRRVPERRRADQGLLRQGNGSDLAQGCGPYDHRGLPDSDTLREIEHRSGKTSVMVRGFNVNQNQVNVSGDSLVEQSRPLLQIEDIREAIGDEMGLLDSRDWGFFSIAMPEFWDRPEMSGYLRDMQLKPDKYEWLKRAPPSLIASVAGSGSSDAAILGILRDLDRERSA